MVLASLRTDEFPFCAAKSSKAADQGPDTGATLDLSFSGGVAGDSCSEFTREGYSCEDSEASGSSATGKLLEHKKKPAFGTARGRQKGTEVEEVPARCSRAGEVTNCLAHWKYPGLRSIIVKKSSHALGI
jgi:hypothetical protein